MSTRKLAQIAYDAYGDELNWKNFMGNPMPAFDDLPDAIKRGWEVASRAAAKAVASQILEHYDNLTNALKTEVAPTKEVENVPS